MSQYKKLTSSMPLLAILALGGCVSLAPEAEVPVVVAALPDAYSAGENASETAQDYRPQSWWTQFNDPVLNGLVDRALDANLDIAEAAARVGQARSQARLARSALSPTLEATGGASYSDSSLSGSAFGNFAGGASRLVTESYSLGLGAAYEIDLFGKSRSDLEAARADAIASEQDFHAVRLAIAAQTISAYFDTVDARRQIAMSALMSDVLSERVARTQERYRRGLVESFELYQVRQELRSLEASQPARKIALEASQGQLAILLAQYPEEIARLLDSPLNPRLVFDDVPTGLPAQLLEQRPDVAAAWLRMDGARIRIGARRAERYPSIRLSASTGSQGSNPFSALDFGQNWLLSLGANLVAPILDGGRISSNIEAARASYDQNAAAYARSVLTAYNEVHQAITAYEEQRNRYSLILAQLDDAKASLGLQSERYSAGVGDYVGYLDALRTSYQVEANLSSSARDVALARLGVHRALGGDWSISTEDFATNGDRP